MDDRTGSAKPAPRSEQLILVPIEQVEVEEGLVCRDVPVIAPDSTAGDTRELLLSRTFESVEDVAVCDDGRLVGMLRIEDLLPAPDGTLVRDLMDADPPVVMPGVDQEAAAWKAAEGAEGSIGVVDADGNFVGFIPPWHMLLVLLRMHDENVARIGGFLMSNSLTLAASEESVPRRFWHRVPWLLLGLAGSIGAATIIGGQEETVSRNIILAFFLPGIVYMADAVGTQTEAIVIRGLSAGVTVSQMVVRELVTGVLVGLAMAGLFFPVVLGGWGSSDVAVAVSLSLFAACSTATVVALTFPWVLDRLGKDPAFGSGPLATVVQDLLSIILYFIIAGIIVQ